MPYGFSTKRDFDRAARAIRAVERMEPRPKKGRRPPRRAGGGAAVQSALAIVYAQAGPSTHGASGIALGTEGIAKLLDADGLAQDSQQVKMKSVHRVALTNGAIIRLEWEGELTASDPAPSWDTNKAKGAYVDPADYWAAHTTFAPRKSLAVPDVATPDAADIQWLGGPCALPS